ncbi:cholesterol transport system auxiliary component [Mariprofundus ferrinatatus]|uniref:Cholesterol transport system auxiliary component n=1 Tax=Mariprofundus ferrinatatus TaxID=1921087 RepID=A0A2K8L904_9PROT|nr:ABC-type transport auxiliary lipoprotein family protein [Mariprofundus ferrinatatus]ATX81404.1 cholesterol transport system auxiliary component [Mariprofundus ferrinatatus]
MRNSISVTLILLSLCLLSGCATRNVPPADIYTISPERAENSQHPEPGQLIIKLAPMRTTRAFSGTEILYSDAEHALNSYAYSRWSDAPVRLLQVLFQLALEESGRFAAVIPATSASEAHLLLESTLYDFSHHIHADGTSSGVIRARFYLIDYANKTVIATKEFISTVPAASKNAQSATAALNRAATNVARDYVAWLTEHDRIR